MFQRYFSLAFIFGLIIQVSTAQSVYNCDGKRYLQEVFDSVKITTHQYGKNKSVIGDSIALMMDIYEPKADPAQKRPAIVMAFGGAFISGNRFQLAEFAGLLARRGYVVACIDYRIWPIFVLGFPDSAIIVDVAMKAMGDMKASIRYIKSRALDFRIDTSLVFAGGISAGAINAIHTAYLDAGDQIPAFLQQAIDRNGGPEGGSGPSTLSYSSKVRGVLNLSGGIFDLGWIDAGEPMMVSMHGTADEIVPYGDGLAAGLVGFKGSGVIHPALKSKNIKEVLITVPGGGHTDIYFEPQFAFYVDSFISVATSLFHQEACNNLTSGIFSNTITQAKVFPTPAKDYVIVESSGNRPIQSARLIDIMGKSISVQYDQNRIHFSSYLSAGMYLLELIYPGQKREIAKVIIRQ